MTRKRTRKSERSGGCKASVAPRTEASSASVEREGIRFIEATFSAPGPCPIETLKNKKDDPVSQTSAIWRVALALHDYLYGGDSWRIAAEDISAILPAVRVYSSDELARLIEGLHTLHANPEWFTRVPKSVYEPNAEGLVGPGNQVLPLSSRVMMAYQLHAISRGLVPATKRGNLFLHLAEQLWLQWQGKHKNISSVITLGQKQLVKTIANVLRVDTKHPEKLQRPLKALNRELGVYTSLAHPRQSDLIRFFGRYMHNNVPNWAEQADQYPAIRDAIGQHPFSATDKTFTFRTIPGVMKIECWLSICNRVDRERQLPLADRLRVGIVRARTAITACQWGDAVTGWEVLRQLLEDPSSPEGSSQQIMARFLDSLATNAMAHIGKSGWVGDPHAPPPWSKLIRAYPRDSRFLFLDWVCRKQVPRGQKLASLDIDAWLWAIEELSSAEARNFCEATVPHVPGRQRTELLCRAAKKLVYSADNCSACWDFVTRAVEGRFGVTPISLQHELVAQTPELGICIALPILKTRMRNKQELPVDAVRGLCSAMKRCATGLGPLVCEEIGKIVFRYDHVLLSSFLEEGLLSEPSVSAMIARDDQLPSLTIAFLSQEFERAGPSAPLLNACNQLSKKLDDDDRLDELVAINDLAELIDNALRGGKRRKRAPRAAAHSTNVFP